MSDTKTSVSGDPVSFDEVPLERLEAELSGLAASIASATCAWLLTLAAYDRRAGWESWDCKSCAHWLTWKCGMSPRAAREHVRVGRALEELPLVADAFRRGRLSYCKVRAICRAANEDNEAELVDLAVAMTGSQLERTIAGLVRAGRNQDEEAADAIAARRVSFDSNHDGTHTITLIVPIEEAAKVKAAIDERLDVMIGDAAAPGQSRRDVIEHRGGLAAIRADAAVELLTVRPENEATEPQPFDVTVVIDPTVDDDLKAERAGQPTQSGSAEPPEHGGVECRIGAESLAPVTALRLCCDSIVSPAIEHITPGGAKTLIDIGRRSREIPRKLRRALERRDNNCCQFPGCDATRRLHAHHIIWWRNLGPTDLDNLVLVCHFHHRVIHEGKWIVRSVSAASGSGGAVEFIDPTGQVATGEQLPADPFALAEPKGHHLGSHWSGESLDYAMITGDCIHNERVNRHRKDQQEQEIPGRTPKSVAIEV